MEVRSVVLSDADCCVTNKSRPAARLHPNRDIAPRPPRRGADCTTISNHNAPKKSCGWENQPALLAVYIWRIRTWAFVPSPFPFCPAPRLFSSFSVPKFRSTMDFVSTVLIASFAAWLVYVVGQAVYRSWFSPVAGFPGPKLAAVSFW
jgi:hypothetical protein